LRLALPTFVG